MRCFCCLCLYETVKLLSYCPPQQGPYIKEEINIGVRRLLPVDEKAHHRYDLRREQLGGATSGLELYRNRLKTSRTRVYVIAAPDVIILLAGPSCQQLLSSFSCYICYITPLRYLFIPSPLDLKSHIPPANILQTPTLLQHL